MEKTATVTEQLWHIIHNEPRSIRCRVAKEALECEDNPTSFFKNLMKHGCVSGYVSSLIYYRDTHKFYDTFYDEIEELRLEYEQMNGEPIKVKGDLKNYYCWFSFELVSQYLMNELGID